MPIGAQPFRNEEGRVVEGAGIRTAGLLSDPHLVMSTRGAGLGRGR
jgi:hypothetical protein